MSLTFGLLLGGRVNFLNLLKSVS